MSQDDPYGNDKWLFADEPIHKRQPQTHGAGDLVAAVAGMILAVLSLVGLWAANQ